MLVLEPLRGQIKPNECTFRVVKLQGGKKSKIELTLVKESTVHWDTLEGEQPDSTFLIITRFKEIYVHAFAVLSTFPAEQAPSEDAEAKRKRKKDWDGITKDILSKEKAKTTSDDPNAGGDMASNEFFQQLYTNADEATQRAMKKSYQESNGTVLSTNWAEVGKGEVVTKPPTGQEAKKW